MCVQLALRRAAPVQGHARRLRFESNTLTGMLAGMRAGLQVLSERALCLARLA